MRGKGHRTTLLVTVAALGVAACVVPAAAIATAEHIVIPVVNEPTPVDPFTDPCSGIVVHGTGIENGFVKITELGAQGHHVQVRIDGQVDLKDAAEVVVGTWTYRIRFSDQFPPGGQGAVSFQAVGPVVYTNGNSAVITLHSHQVFEKGDVEKRAFEKAKCN